ncbi:MAG: hypothetical protein AAGC72_06475 [Planctomycetota bacterium]
MRVMFIILGVLILLCLCAPTTAVAQADWSNKVLNQRDRERKEQIAARLAQDKGVSYQTLLTLAEQERHGPAVLFVAGQYFHKVKQVPDEIEAIRVLATRRDIGYQVIAFATMSRISEQLIQRFTASAKEIDRQLAAKMIASLAVMRHGGPVEPVLRPNQNKLDTAWLKADHSTSLKTIIETSVSRDTLEYAFFAAGLDKVEAVRELAREHINHRVQDVAFAARFALISLGEEVDREKIINALSGAEKGRPKSELSFDPGHTALVYAVMTAGEARLVEAVEPLLDMVNTHDLHTAVAAVRALEKIGAKGMVSRLIQAISPDTPWPVRAAIYNAAGSNPDPTVIHLLMDRFKIETGRLRQDVLYAMLSIAGGGPEALTIEAFQIWWQANSKSFNTDKEATAQWRKNNRIHQVEVAAFAGFYETAVISDRLVFTIDASKSVAGDQLASLHQTMTELFTAFPDDLQFNLIDFGGHIRVLAKRRMMSGKISERALNLFINETELTYGTWAFEAIEAAMDLPEVDTIHFLSDGQPWASQLNDWNRIRFILRLKCATVPITVNMLYFPPKGNPQQIAKTPLAKQMRDFSEETSGRFQVIVPKP